MKGNGKGTIRVDFDRKVWTIDVIRMCDDLGGGVKNIELYSPWNGRNTFYAEIDPKDNRKINPENIEKYGFVSKAYFI